MNLRAFLTVKARLVLEILVFLQMLQEGDSHRGVVALVAIEAESSEAIWALQLVGPVVGALEVLEQILALEAP